MINIWPNRYIAPEQVPVKYGGLSRDGEQEFTTADPATEVTIKPATKHAVEFPVSEVRNKNLFDIQSYFLKRILRMVLNCGLCRGYAANLYIVGKCGCNAVVETSKSAISWPHLQLLTTISNCDPYIHSLYVDEMIECAEKHFGLGSKSCRLECELWSRICA